MGLPHILLVDDSEAVLAFIRAALAGHYQLSTAVNGLEALAKIPQLKPSAVLLDLSMPALDGDEVLARMQRDPEQRRIPVIIISSEKARAEACLRAGAKAYLAKPIRAAELLAIVSRVLDEAQRKAREGNVAALFVTAGPHELALPLESVRSVLHQLATRPLPLGPAYLCEVFELYGNPVCVLDLPQRLGVAHTRRIDERKLVVVEHGQLSLALCVDSVREPEELPAADFVAQSGLGGAEHGPLAQALRGMLRTPRGPVPLIEPLALVSRELLQTLAQQLRAGAGAP